MRSVILLVLIISTASYSVSFAKDNLSKENVAIDNVNVQEYKGRVGIWLIPGSKGKLYGYLNKYQSSIKDVRKLNGKGFTYAEYIFVPYSDEYLKELKKKGIERQAVKTSKNEFVWPLIMVNNISSSFGKRGRRFHTGADMPATRGTPIIAVMDGRVLSSRYEGGFGKTVCIEHRDNFYTRYAHNSVNLVKAGDFVKKGQVIGFVGCTGRSTGNHLHFEIRYNEIPLNPLDFLPFKEHLKKAHNARTWK